MTKRHHPTEDEIERRREQETDRPAAGTQQRNVDDLINDMAEMSRCPGCDKRLADMGTFPARSRFGHGDLCAECGLREAFENDFITARTRARLAAAVARKSR